MKQRLDYSKIKKIIFIWMVSLAGVAMALPYQYSLQKGFVHEEMVQFVYFSIGQVLLYAVFLFFLVMLGQAFAEQTRLGTPILSALLDKQPVTPKWQQLAGISSLTGLVLGGTIIVFEWVFFRSLFPRFDLTITTPAWQNIMASFYGGFTEEVMLRFFLMSFLVWTMMRVLDKKEQTSTIIWSAITVTALVFALVHIPITVQIVKFSSLVVIRSLLLNGLSGMVLGYLYWKNGLESAMLAHFSLDLVIHVIYPLMNR